MRLPIAIAIVAALVVTGTSSRAQQSDLDAFMKQVLSRRDDNWTKLQQYTLEEDETFQISALNGRRLYGFKREYTWYPREDGVFMRSPVRADGVTLSESARRRAEDAWLKREAERDKARQKREEQREQERADADPGTGDVPGLNDLVKPGNEPRFVSSAYFMKFKFDEGSYAFAGREQLLGREVLKIEYYPKRYFQDDRKRDNATGKKTERDRQREDQIERKMDKVSMITLWIEPTDQQILQYEFSNIDFDFLPGRALVRLDEMRAAMRMREAFPDVWLPDSIAMSFGMTLALGEIAAKYDVKYHDYKLAEVKARVR